MNRKQLIWSALAFLLFAALFLVLRLPWVSCDAGLPSMWEYGYNVTDEGYYLVGGKLAYLTGHFVDLACNEPSTYGYAPGLHYLSFLAYRLFGLSDWAWRIPFVAINFAAWSMLFFALRRRFGAWGALAVSAAFSSVPMIIAYERTASNDVLIGSLLVMSVLTALGRGWWRAVVSAALVAAISLVKPSVWFLLPLSGAAVAYGRPLKPALKRLGLFLGAFIAALALAKLGVYLATLPDARLTGLSVSEILSRMQACYPFPKFTDFASHFRAVACFPRDPSSTLLGPMAALLVPVPVFFVFRGFRANPARSVFAAFIVIYIAAVSVMNTIYTHYFIPAMAVLPILWMMTAADDAPPSEHPVAWRELAVDLVVLVAGAFFLYLLYIDVSKPTADAFEAYSRIYNLPKVNVWTISAVPAVLYTVVIAALSRSWRASLGALAAGSVGFAMLAAVRISPALRKDAAVYLWPMILVLFVAALVFVLVERHPGLARRSWVFLPLLAVVAGYVFVPAWRQASAELLRPGTHYHRDAAQRIAQAIPAKAIVIGERSDLMLMSTPHRTGATINCNSEGTVLAEEIWKTEPEAEIYLLADTQHSYNLQNFQKHKDRYALRPVLTLKAPSFGSGLPVDVYLCRVERLGR